MGMYLNPGSTKFLEAVNSKIYVDKTEMISYLNSVLRTEQKYVSVSRPRRFGKSIAANMLCAYYGKEDSREDVLTMLIHLGYLGYDADTKEIFIPNNEILDEFKTSTKSREWVDAFRSFKKSPELPMKTAFFERQ